MFFSKRLFAIAVICSSFLAAEESLSLYLNPDEDFLSSTKEKSQFLYIAGGINPFPTFSFGYRKLYGSFGSDFSISVSTVPLPLGRDDVFIAPIPGIVYKQLFFTKSWKRVEPGRSVFYFGLDVGVYPLGEFTVNGGGLIGWQFKRKARSDFFEIGINPILCSEGMDFRIVPLGSLTYGFMF